MILLCHCIYIVFIPLVIMCVSCNINSVMCLIEVTIRSITRTSTFIRGRNGNLGTRTLYSTFGQKVPNEKSLGLLFFARPK